MSEVIDTDEVIVEIEVSERAAQLSRAYPHVVYWSDEDQLFIGSCPVLMGDACHGDEPAIVFEELREIVSEVVQTYLDRNEELPDPTAWRTVEATPERSAA